MNMTIQKYPLNILGRDQRVMLPPSSEILSVKKQNNSLVLFAMFDAEKPQIPLEERSIKILPTSIAFEFSGKHKYLGSVLLNDSFTYHAFEVV